MASYRRSASTQAARASSVNFYAEVADLMIHIVNVQQGEGADEALLKIAADRLAG